MNLSLRRILPVLGLAATLAACDTNAPDAAALTPAETAVAASIVAQAVADQSEGMVSDLYDMDAGLDATGLGYGEGAMGKGRGKPGMGDRRGGLRQDGRVVYDPATGTHRVQYTRTVESPVLKKALSVDLAYVFTDAAGGFLARPRADRDLVAKVTFAGERKGSSTLTRRDGATHASAFEREASWALAGLTGASATFAGEQASKGSFRTVGADGVTNERAFTATLRTDGVTITKANAGDGVEDAITGTLAYTVTMRRVQGAGDPQTREVTGTIELAGNGRALLRFMGLPGKYRVDLSTGDVAAEG